MQFILYDCVLKLIIITLVNKDFIAKLLQQITFDCTGEPCEVAAEILVDINGIYVDLSNDVSV